MGKRGPQPKYKINLTWRPELAYAIGLLITDGNLSKDRRHIIFVSKDIQQINNFNKCLEIKPKLGKTVSGYNGKSSYRVQFGNVIFYDFLLSIGIMPAKSKIIGKVFLPDNFFWDCLRGCFDGDGCFYSYWDKRWRSSYMFYLTFSSASLKHILWLQNKINGFLSIRGHISRSKRPGSIYNLRYAKKEALVIIGKMYYDKKVVCLLRKRIKIDKALTMDKKQQRKYIK